MKHPLPHFLLLLVTGISLLLLVTCTKKQDTQEQSNNEPAVSTNTITLITATTATGGGNVTSDGGSAITSRGICWNTSPNPEVTGSHTTDGSGMGSFSSSITGLTPNTPYYVRAYVTNIKGTVYGNQVTFTSDAEHLATVTTNAVTNITQTTVTAGGNVTSEGSYPVTERGVCWSTSPNPTTANSHAVNGSGTGTFSGTVTGLTAGTPYYIKAYAKNSAGTAYGEQLTFTTEANQTPQVTTDPVTYFGETYASGGGNVTAQGTTAVTERGLCWSTVQSPTTGDSRTSNGNGTGIFTGDMMSLSAGTTYYVRAYATNSYGTAYGNEVNFTTTGTFSCGRQFTDVRDGHNYQTTQIGTQCWMATNLNVGTRMDGLLKQTRDDITKYCYDNDESNCTTYGGLYTWLVMMRGSYNPGIQGICPGGWHIPTDAQWCTVTKFMDPTVNCGAEGWDDSGVGFLMKSISGWNIYNGNNQFGFNALPAGYRDLYGPFEGMHQFTYFWSSSCDISGNRAWSRWLSSVRPDIYRTTDTDEDAYSVRCVKN